MPTAVSLFSGCGGSDLGLVEAGFDVLMANDISVYAKNFYERNLPKTDYHLGDIQELRSFPKADLLVGCYPCQGFSEGGVRDASRSINYLYREFDRALRSIRPKAFVVENVSGMTRSNNTALLNNQVTRFRMAGYRVKKEVLFAPNYGVPQDRRRLFFVGIRSDIDMPYEFPNSSVMTSRIKAKGTIGEALHGKPEWPDPSTYDTQPFHWYYMSRNRRRHWEDRAATIVANSRHTGLHPVSPELVRRGPDHWEFISDYPARRFSYEECALLQGFPDDIVFPDSRGIRDKYKIIGNAVPPPVFCAVASSLKPALM